MAKAKETAKDAAPASREAPATSLVTIEHPDGRRVTVTREAFTDLYESNGFVTVGEPDVDYVEPRNFAAEPTHYPAENEVQPATEDTITTEDESGGEDK